MLVHQHAGIRTLRSFGPVLSAQRGDPAGDLSLAMDDLKACIAMSVTEDDVVAGAYQVRATTQGSFFSESALFS